MILLFFWFLLAVNRLDRRQEALGKQLLEDTIRRTAAACYASEGAYPPGVAHMEQYYGLRYDKRRYMIHYEMFASNLMPEITVLEVMP